VSVYNSNSESGLLADRVMVFLTSHYSNSDHDFFDYVHGTQVFSELTCHQVIIQKTVFETRFDSCGFLIVFSEPIIPGKFY